MYQRPFRHVLYTVTQSTARCMRDRKHLDATSTDRQCVVRPLFSRADYPKPLRRTACLAQRDSQWYAHPVIALASRTSSSPLFPRSRAHHQSRLCLNLTQDLRSRASLPRDASHLAPLFIVNLYLSHSPFFLKMGLSVTRDDRGERGRSLRMHARTHARTQAGKQATRPGI